MVTTLSRRSIRDNVIDWPLDYATRSGFNPDKLVGRVLNQLTSVRHKIKQRYNFVVHYEDYLVTHNMQATPNKNIDIKTRAKEHAKSHEQNKSNQIKNTHALEKKEHN
ncbi:MAG: hypothetical protein P1U36_09325 [Legionellaceae bacterium]|nr:hypothetical protein [Legionellaceae bacterium]